MARKRKHARATPDDREADVALPIARRHMRFGWWCLLGFLALGLFLESLHGFKVGWYLDVSRTTRRHMWTLAHAHGTLLAVVNLILGATVHRLPQGSRRNLDLASICLLAATVLLPAGFFLGGTITYGGDPGLGILLVPVGAVLLAVAVFLVARSWSS